MYPLLALMMTSSICPEYDSYAVMIKLTHPTSEKLSDSFYRHQFIKNICESNSICEKSVNGYH